MVSRDSFALNLTEVDYRHFKPSAAVRPNDAVRRIHAKKKAGTSRRNEIRFLALLTAGLCVPTLGTLIAIFWTAEPDISDLTPVSRNVGDYLILHWSDLERGRRMPSSKTRRCLLVQECRLLAT